MLSYLKYMLSVSRKFIMTWAVYPALYFTILPLRLIKKALLTTSINSFLIHLCNFLQSQVHYQLKV